MRVDMRVAIPGLREFRNELRRAGDGAEKGLQRENKRFAEALVPEVQRAYQSYYPRPTSRPRRRRRGGRTVEAIRARATQTSASIVIGGARYPHMLGQEFGSEKFRQFAPWTGPSPSGRGSAGRFLFPTMRERVPDHIERYGDAVMAAYRGAFPDRGVS